MKKLNLILTAFLIFTAFAQAQQPISDADYKTLLEKSPFNSVYPKILQRPPMPILMRPCSFIQMGPSKKSRRIWPL